MGLSERRIKQRIGHDPRNLSWSDDKSRFSYQHMKNLGWSDNAGIGGSGLSGNPNHIVVARKLDNTGIGMARARKEGDDSASGAGQAGQGLEDVLKRLAAAASASPSHSPRPDNVASEITEVTVTKTVVRGRIASRHRHLHSKRLALSSPAALAAILGVAASSLPVSAVSSPSPATESPALQDSNGDGPSSSGPRRDADETISKSTLSVSDYFRQKMREKMSARHSPSGSSTPAVISVLDRPQAEKAGSVWAGTKSTFDDAMDQDGKRVYDDPVDSMSPVAGGSSLSEFDPTADIITRSPKSARRAEKAARKAGKAERRAARAARKERKEREAKESVEGPATEQVDVAEAKEKNTSRERGRTKRKDKTRGRNTDETGAVLQEEASKSLSGKRSREEGGTDEVKERGRKKKKMAGQA